MKKENEQVKKKEQPHKIGKTFALHELKYAYRRILNSFGEKIKIIHPDVITLMAFLVTLAAGILYGKSGEIPIFLIIGIVLILVRMTFDTLDGLIALKRNRTSMIGKLVNALPDRYADMFILIGIACSSLCNTKIGMIASITVLLVSYSGMLGKAIGVSWQSHGPLDKVDRLVFIMVASLVQFILIKTGRYEITILRASFSVMEWCMLLFILLGHITVLNRTIGMIREILRIERGS